jgi:hypothetical protein
MIQQNSSFVFQWFIVSVGGSGEVSSSCYTVIDDLTLCRQHSLLLQTPGFSAKTFQLRQLVPNLYVKESSTETKSNW